MEVLMLAYFYFYFFLKKKQKKTYKYKKQNRKKDATFTHEKNTLYTHTSEERHLQVRDEFETLLIANPMRYRYTNFVVKLLIFNEKCPCKCHFAK